jgi:hypothetical protein
MSTASGRVLVELGLPRWLFSGITKKPAGQAPLYKGVTGFDNSR